VSVAASVNWKLLGPGDILITAIKVDDNDLRAVHACAVCVGQDPRCG
jgi:hypothetical protein